MISSLFKEVFFTRVNFYMFILLSPQVLPLKFQMETDQRA